jgi:HD superfamily phosphohydrolase
MLEAYRTLSELIARLDSFLKREHPSFFGKSATHPFSRLKAFKVVHDPLWGTNRFSWRELVLLDTPLLQRLRNIHQTGLAHQVYPSAQHSRFEHSLGVVTIASRIFDALVQRQSDSLETIATALSPGTQPSQTLSRLRQELRLAALLHDTGHSLYSHASERVYSKLELLRMAAVELSSFVGKEKGAGEVLSFCLARTDAVAGVLARAKERLFQKGALGEFIGDIDLDNVSLLIVGRSKHPFLQFMGDIISSGFDADKLDYLLRDATAAGLPLRYDLERYLYTVYVEKDVLTDDEGELEKLYAILRTKAEKKAAAPPHVRFPYFDTYRLRLPKQAMSTIEQIVICKLMLFSYIYHHQKVRSAEGLLVKLLEAAVDVWRADGRKDFEILEQFLSMDDSALKERFLAHAGNRTIAEYAYRLVNRCLPRWVYGLNSTFSHAEGALVKEFFSSLQDKARRDDLINRLETAIGEQLIARDRDRAFGRDPAEALRTAGIWVDVPTVPKFEDMKVVIGGSKDGTGVPIKDFFPIGQWTEAYEAHRFYVRIYSFSEAASQVEVASREAIGRVLGVTSGDFFEKCVNPRLHMT